MSRRSRYGWILAMACLSGAVLLAAGIYRLAKPIPIVEQTKKAAAPPAPDKTDALRGELNRVVSLERCNINDLHQAAVDVVVEVNFQSMATIALGKAELAWRRRLLAADLQNVESAKSIGDQFIASANVGSSFEGYRKLQRAVGQIRKRSADFQESEFALFDTMFAMAQSVRKRGYATDLDKKRMEGYVSEARQKASDWQSFQRTVDAETIEQWVWMDRALGGTIPPDKFFAACSRPMSLVRFDDKTDLRLPVLQSDVDQVIAVVQGRWSGYPRADSISSSEP